MIDLFIVTDSQQRTDSDNECFSINWFDFAAIL